MSFNYIFICSIDFDKKKYSYNLWKKSEGSFFRKYSDIDIEPSLITLRLLRKIFNAENLPRATHELWLSSNKICQRLSKP